MDGGERQNRKVSQDTSGKWISNCYSGEAINLWNNEGQNSQSVTWQLSDASFKCDPRSLGGKLDDIWSAYDANLH